MSNKPNKKLTPKIPIRQPVNNAAPKKELETKQKFSVNVKLCFALALISFTVYANTLKNGYVFDDVSAITENAYVTKGISAIPTILATPYRRGCFVIANDLYRPLSLVMFSVEYQFFGNDPMPNHLINILLFAGCVILLFQFLDKLFERKKTAVAFIATLLFALHPIHTEVVANIKSRDELLCFFFAFLSLNVFVKYIQIGKINQLLLGSFCFFLALLSKETVITFLAIIPLIFFFYRNENKKRSSYITISTAVVTIIFLAIRFSVLNFYNANNPTDINFIDNALAKSGLPYESRIATAILILGYYIKLLFVPYPLICNYSYNSIPFVDFGNFGVLISLFIYLFLGYFSISRFLKNHKDLLAFGILFFLITISLFSNVIFLIGTTMGERLMFFPSVGVCITVAILMEKWLGKQTENDLAIFKNKKLLMVLIPVCLVYTVLTIDRNSDWLDNYTLYKADIKKSPNDGKLNYNLALEIEKNISKEITDTAKLKEKREEEVVTYLRKALAIDPDYTDAHINIGNAYFRNSMYDSAEFHEKKAVKLNPKNENAINSLAAVYAKEQKYPLAVELLQRTIALNQNYVNGYSNIGRCYFLMKQYDKAIETFNKALSLDPKDLKDYPYIAMSYNALGNADMAKKYEATPEKNNSSKK